MFEDILNDQDLFSLHRAACEENEVCIEFSEILPEDKYIILKIDAYYSSLRMHNPPRSIDCLIIVQCDTNPCYDFYLVELKNISSTKGFNTKEIRDKFKTTIEDFLKIRFAHIFLNPAYCLNDFKLYFVSDACRIKKRFPDMTLEEYKNSILGTKYDAILSLAPFTFRNKIASIIPLLPNPLIKEC
jgi:hypothetical protein